MFWALIVNIW